MNNFDEQENKFDISLRFLSSNQHELHSSMVFMTEKVDEEISDKNLETLTDNEDESSSPLKKLEIIKDIEVSKKERLFNISKSKRKFNSQEKFEEFRITCTPSFSQLKKLWDQRGKFFPPFNYYDKNEKFHKLLTKEAIYKKFQVGRNKYILEQINSKLKLDLKLKFCVMKNLPNKGFNCKTTLDFVSATLKMSLFDIFKYNWFREKENKGKSYQQPKCEKCKRKNNIEIIAKIKEYANKDLKEYMLKTLEEVTKEYLESKSFKKDKESYINFQAEKCLAWQGYCCGHCSDFQKKFELYIHGIEGREDMIGYIDNFTQCLNKTKLNVETISHLNSSISTDNSK